MNSENEANKEEKPDVGTLADLVYGVNEKTRLEIDVATDEDGKIIVFHNLPFRKDLSWYEYNLSKQQLDFVIEDGKSRNFGFNIKPEIAKNMQNSHQILTILLDNETGQPKEGTYVPLIIHQD